MSEYTAVLKSVHIQGEKPRSASPRHRRPADMSVRMGLCVLAVCAALYAAGILRGAAPMQMLTAVCALAGAALPIWLAFIPGFTLKSSVRRLSKQNITVKNLRAFKSLAGVSVIISGKNGIFTQKDSSVRCIWPAGHDMHEMNGCNPPEALRLLRLGAMCLNTADADTDGEDNNKALDAAILRAMQSAGSDRIMPDEKYPRLAEIPPSKNRPLMTTVHQVGDNLLSVTKGCYRAVLPLCTEGETGRACEAGTAMEKAALQAVGVAYRELDALPEEITAEALEQNLTFMGIIGIGTPPADTSKTAVENAKAAGISPVMVTEGPLAPAKATARQLGILNGHKAMSAEELENFTDEGLSRVVGDYCVYAGASPSDKQRIIKALQEKGLAVVAAGLFSADIPAMKTADISFAAEDSGNAVKRAADIILSPNGEGFAAIVETIRESRIVSANIRSVSQYAVSAGLGMLLLSAVPVCMGRGMPLTAFQILLAGLVIGALPIFALCAGSRNKKLSPPGPAPKEKRGFAGIGYTVLLRGVLIGVPALAAYYIGGFIPVSGTLRPSPEIASAMAFLALSLSLVSLAAGLRGARALFKPWGVIGTVLSLAVMAAVCVIPPLSAIFGVPALSGGHPAIALVLGALPLVATANA
ncbi:MAG: cation-translocating P-type ATPase [Oscillospiraceae bacterium]|nr:cation-translocating P-type ATPase [Oscillospiraceae bacterium]